MNVGCSNRRLLRDFLADALGNLPLLLIILSIDFSNDADKFCPLAFIIDPKGNGTTGMYTFNGVDDSFQILWIDVLAAVDDQVFFATSEIGRASCRERGYISGVAVAV